NCSVRDRETQQGHRKAVSRPCNKARTKRRTKRSAELHTSRQDHGGFIIGDELPLVGSPCIGDQGAVSAVIAGHDEHGMAALTRRSQEGFEDRVRSSQSYGTSA